MSNGPDSVHLFCGAGGDTLGFFEAGYQPVAAANHDPVSISTHEANFPDTEHLCVDLDHYDMRRIPRGQVLVASPICTEISPAGGRKRRKNVTHGQLELLEHGPVSEATWERTRLTAYDILRYVEIHHPDAVVCENVVEFGTDWPLFRWWIQAMEILGYRRQIVCVSAAHIGDERNPHAPQWRDRIFVIFTKRGIRRPKLEPQPAAWCFTCEETVAAVQSWKDPRKGRIGKYRAQYVYRCSNARCRHAIVEPFVLPAASAIDWSHIGQRIGDRARPLAASTMRRIKAGLDLFAGRPTMVTVNHADDDPRAYPAFEAPLPTRTVKIGDGLAVHPMVLPVGGWNQKDDPRSALEPMAARMVTDTDALLTPPFLTVLRSGRERTIGVNEPLATVVASGSNHLLVEPGPFIAMLRGPNNRARGVDEPLATVTTGRNHALVAPGAFITMLRNNCTPYPVTDPLTTIAAGGNHHTLVIPYYRTGRAKTTAVPLDTVTVKDRFGLLAAVVEVDDCHYRMLQPREHLRAQRFPDPYLVHGNKGQQTAQAGNAVPVNVARWIAERVKTVLDGSTDRSDG